ncbi:hypothetical protein B296_00016145 [Ensete ventricosum]|uniref:Expansin-like EG45 domain-containing protein n=1 Tax=Ensete ventricosum TaxID=4639 RepID=A0A427B4R9_ENSVE|nr:hypothetical protein B296_00016145 [Ensete ventricosum]
MAGCSCHQCVVVGVSTVAGSRAVDHGESCRGLRLSRRRLTLDGVAKVERRVVESARNAASRGFICGVGGVTLGCDSLLAGGACGYGSLVDVRPLRARVGAVSPVLFKGGQGCGACYKVRCLDPSICSRRAVTVIVTDECPGGYCASGRTHFDLSGAAFGRMAVVGEAGQIRDRGEISVVFRSVGLNLVYSLLQASSVEWLEMKHIWGGNWCFNGGPLQGPFSVKLTTLTTQKTFSAWDVIPSNWSPDATYTSRLNFL